MAKPVISELLHILKSSVSAVLPENLVRNNLKYNPANELLTICGEQYNLQNRNVYVVGAGKAVRNMAIEVENILSSKIRKGIISVPEGSLKTASKVISYYEGARNNLPDKNSESTSQKIIELVKSLTKQDVLIVLISGGGSALLSLPKFPVTLEEKTDLIKKLANSGADIKELNIVRKKLSDVKGGKLANYAHPATITSLILSDIVGDPIDLIASGPTVENLDSSSMVMDIIDKYNLFHNLPHSIRKVLEEPEKHSTFPKEYVKNIVIGSNKISLAAAVAAATELNYSVLELSNSITGNVTEIAQEYVKLVESFCKVLRGELNFDTFRIGALSLNIPSFNVDNSIMKLSRGLCLVLGGELTVEVKGSGKGGRNQQLALEFSKIIHDFKDKLEDFDIYLLSGGTDGIDGPTDAAGAIGYKDLFAKATELNMDVDNYLNNNDSYNFYKEFDNGNLHVITGHTGTNVMDIHVILIKGKSNI